MVIGDCDYDDNDDGDDYDDSVDKHSNERGTQNMGYNNNYKGNVFTFENNFKLYINHTAINYSNPLSVCENV